MPSIFTATQGTVMAVEVAPNQGASTPFQIEVDGGRFGVDQISGIITAFTLTGDTNVQFTNTLRNVIYVSVFGDKIGNMTISGLLFLNNPALCGLAASGSGGGLKAFLSKFYEIYVVNRAEAVKISLGNIIVSGFITGFQAQVVDAQFSIGQFTMQIAALPKPEGA